MSSGDTSWYGRLDRSVIIDAALRVAARPGVREVRFRDLGVELDADPTAVYRHFRSKAELMAALIDRLMHEVSAVLPASAGWRKFMRAMAKEVFDRFLAHPAVGVHLVDSRVVGPSELAVVEASLQAFEEAGLSGDALVAHYSAFSGMLLAYVAAACRERVTAVLERPDDATAWLATEAGLVASSLPRLTRYAPGLAALDFRSTYFAGVEVLIDSVARTGAAREA